MNTQRVKLVHIKPCKTWWVVKIMSVVQGKMQMQLQTPSRFHKMIWYSSSRTKRSFERCRNVRRISAWKFGKRIDQLEKVVYENFVKQTLNQVHLQLIQKLQTKLMWLKLLVSTYLLRGLRIGKIVTNWSIRRERCSWFKWCSRPKTGKLNGWQM